MVEYSTSRMVPELQVLVQALASRVLPLACIVLSFPACVGLIVLLALSPFISLIILPRS